MKIVTKETLGKMPIGTVFTTWQPHYADEDLHIKTGEPYDDKASWNGELLLCPEPYNISDITSLNEDIHSIMWTTDNTDIDYEDNQLFMVFSCAEILNMANVLVWAANGCQGECNTNNISFVGNKIIEEKDY